MKIKSLLFWSMLAVPVGLAGALPSCTPTMSGKASEMFSLAKSCPPDKITELDRGAPQREPGVCGEHVVEVTGCDHRATYCCSMGAMPVDVNGRLYDKTIAQCQLQDMDGAP
jgi:hypothetical protein